MADEEAQGRNTPEQDQENLENERLAQEVADVMGELQDLYLDREMAEARKLQGLPAEAVEYDFDAEVQRLEQRLYDLGVRDVGPDELREITKNDPVPFIEAPPSTNSVKWSVQKYTYTYNGESYYVQHLFAKGQDGNTNLANGKTGEL